MISISQSRDINPYEVLRRSSVANVEGAQDILHDCLYRSMEVRYGLVDGEAACMWGLIPPTILSDSAYLWLLTTELVAEHKFLFIRHSQRYIEEALKKYPLIIGDVVGNNRSTIRWLKFLGAEFTRGINGRMLFTIRKKVLNG